MVTMANKTTAMQICANHHNSILKAPRLLSVEGNARIIAGTMPSRNRVERKGTDKYDVNSA